MRTHTHEIEHRYYETHRSTVTVESTIRATKCLRNQVTYNCTYRRLPLNDSWEQTSRLVQEVDIEFQNCTLGDEDPRGLPSWHRLIEVTPLLLDQLGFPQGFQPLPSIPVPYFRISFGMTTRHFPLQIFFVAGICTLFRILLNVEPKRSWFDSLPSSKNVLTVVNGLPSPFCDASQYVLSLYQSDHTSCIVVEFILLTETPNLIHSILTHHYLY